MKSFFKLKFLFDFSNVLFLYFSWLELKYVESFLAFNPDFPFLCIPLCKKWFYRTSFLLKNNKYNYFEIQSLKKFYVRNAFNFTFYNNKVIENAIFNSVFPFFRNNYFFKNLSLIEYVI